MFSGVRVLWMALSLTLLAGSLRAHQPFEVTSVGRLQHGRLELSVTLSLVMANFLLKDPAKPDGEPVNAESFDHHRKELAAIATGFYRVTEGEKVLEADKVLVFLNRFGEPEFRLVYPEPRQGPLSFEVGSLKAPGQEGAHTLRIFDDAETLLAETSFGGPRGERVLRVPLPVSSTAGHESPSPSH